MKPSGGLQQKRTCWIDANKKERIVIVLRAAKNDGDTEVGQTYEMHSVYSSGGEMSS